MVAIKAGLLISFLKFLQRRYLLNSNDQQSFSFLQNSKINQEYLLDFFKQPENSFEIFDFFCNYCIGTGASRKVYPLLFNENYVIKYEYTYSHNNIVEWDFYMQLPEAYKQYFARPILLSTNGKLMLQERTFQPLKYPDYILSILADTKKENFGITKDNRFVCHDWANHRMFTTRNGMNEKPRFKKSNFWSWQERDIKPLI